MNFFQPNDTFNLGLVTYFTGVVLLFKILMRLYIHYGSQAQPYDLDHSTI